MIGETRDLKSYSLIVIPVLCSVSKFDSEPDSSCFGCYPSPFSVSRAAYTAAIAAALAGMSPR